ncbi:MAG: hypothetical protein CG442_617, partial [Methylococcaceae bacterium NSO1]
ANYTIKGTRVARWWIWNLGSYKELAAYFKIAERRSSYRNVLSI